MTGIPSHPPVSLVAEVMAQPEPERLDYALGLLALLDAPHTLARRLEADLLDGWGTADVAARHPADRARVRAILAHWRRTGKLSRLAREARERWAGERKEHAA